MEWVGCIHCAKFQIDFMAQICALIAPVHPILHRVSCSIETLANALKCYEMQTLPNALKCYETQQNESLGSTLLDRVCSLRKIPRGLHGTNFCINCNGLDWVRLLRKIPMRLYGTNLCIDGTSSTRFAPSFV